MTKKISSKMVIFISLVCALTLSVSQFGLISCSATEGSGQQFHMITEGDSGEGLPCVDLFGICANDNDCCEGMICPTGSCCLVEGQTCISDADPNGCCPGLSCNQIVGGDLLIHQCGQIPN